jgi:hypothetical protein
MWCEILLFKATFSAQNEMQEVKNKGTADGCGKTQRNNVMMENYKKNTLCVGHLRNP